MDSCRQVAVGVKDVSKSAFAVWENLFHLPSAKQMRVTSRMGPAAGNRLAHSTSLIHSNGEYDKLMQGCFENYLHIPKRDPSMEEVPVLPSIP